MRHVEVENFVNVYRAQCTMNRKVDLKFIKRFVFDRTCEKIKLTPEGAKGFEAFDAITEYKLKVFDELIYEQVLVLGSYQHYNHLPTADCWCSMLEHRTYFVIFTILKYGQKIWFIRIFRSI